MTVRIGTLEGLLRLRDEFSTAMKKAGDVSSSSNKKIQSQLDKTKRSTKGWSKELKSLVGDLDKTTGSQLKYLEVEKKLTTALRKGELTQEQYNDAIRKAKSAYLDATSGADKFSKSAQKLGRNLSSAGSNLALKLTLPILGVGTAATRSFGNFDAAMAKSLAIMGDVSPALRREMESTARSIAKTTKFSAEQSAESYFFLASAGLDAASSISALPAVSKFAQAGMFDMARATDLLTDAQSALGLTVRDDAVKNLENMIGVSDVLVKANTVANASVEQFATSLTTKAATAMKQLNIDIESGVAVLAAWADQGVKAEQAGERFNIVTRDLQTAFLKNRDVFKQHNIEVFDSKENFRDLADIIGDMEDSLGSMSPEQQKASLMMLGFTDRSVQATQSLIGLSGLIRKYESDLRNAGGTTEEVARKQLEAFNEKMRLIKDSLVDAGITLGTSLAPIIENFANNVLVPLIEKLSKGAEWFGKLDTATQMVIVSVAGLTAAAGPLLIVTGQLTIAAGALAPLLPKIAIGFRAASVAAAAFNISLGPILITIGAILAVALLVRNELKRLVDQWQRDIDKIVRKADEAAAALDRWRKVKVEGLISVEEWDKLGDSIETSRGRISKLESQLRGVNRARQDQIDLLGAAPRHLNIQRDALDKEIQTERNHLKVLENTYDSVVKVTHANDDLAEVFPHLTKETNNLGGGIKQLTEEQLKAIKAWKATAKEVSVNVVQAKLIAKATKEGKTALAKALITIRLWNAALSRGVDPLSEWGQALIEAEGKIILAENAAKLAANEIEALEESTRRFNETIAEQGPVSGPILPPVDIDLSDETIRRIKESLGESVGRLSDGIRDNLNEGIQSAIADGFTNGFDSVDVEGLFSSLAKIGSDIIAEQLGAAITAAIDGQAGAWKSLKDFATSSAGQWAGALGTAGNIINANNATYAAIGAVIGGAIGGALTGGTFSWMGAFIGSAIGGAIKHGAPVIRGEIESAFGTINVTGAIAAGAKSVGGQMEEGFRKIVNDLGAIFHGFAGSIDLQMREGMNVIIGGVKHYFERENIAEGIQFAIVEALKNSDLTGISDDTRAALQHTVASTMEGLVSDLDFARFFEQINLDEVAKSFDDTVDEFHRIWNRMVDLGIDGADRLKAWLGRALEAQRNSILGIQETEAERIRRQSQSFNAQVKLTEAEALAKKAELLIRKADIEAAMAELNAKESLLDRKISLIRAGIDLDKLQLTAEEKVLYAKVAMLAATEQALAAIDALLDSLPALISNAEINAAIGRIGRSGGNLGNGLNQAATDMETLESTLDAFDLSLLSEVDRSIADINNRFAENAKLAHDNAVLLERANAMREKELDLLRETIRAKVTQHLPELRLGSSGGGIGMMFGSSAWDEEMAAIREWATLVTEENARILEETGKAAFTAAELAAATANQIRALVDDAIDSLNLPLESTKDRFRTLGDTMKFLSSQVTDGTLSAEKFGDIVSQIADVELLAFGDALLGFLDRYYGDVEGFEDFRLQLEQVRFHLELANMKLQFQLLKDLGLLTKKTIGDVQEVFNWIDDNIPDLGAGTGSSPAPSVSVSGSTSVDNFQRERDAARDAIQDIIRSAMDPYDLALLEFHERFDEYRRLLGNTAEVQQAFNIGLQQLNDQYTQGLRDFLETFRDVSLPPAQQVASLQARFLELAATGSIGQSEELLRLAQQLQSAYGTTFGTAHGGYQNLLNMIEAAITAFLGQTGQTVAPVVGNLNLPSAGSGSGPLGVVPNNVASPGSSSLLSQIEQNTRATRDEVHRSNMEMIVNRRIAHRDASSIADAYRHRGVKVG